MPEYTYDLPYPAPPGSESAVNWIMRVLGIERHYAKKHTILDLEEKVVTDLLQPRSQYLLVCPKRD